MNDIVGALCDLLMTLLGWLHPVLLILVLALLLAAGSLMVFKWTTNQAAVRRAKGKVGARLVGVVLFRHDLRLLFRNLGLAFVGSLANLRFLAVPLLVLIVPMTLLFVQFERRLGFRGLAVDERTVVRVHAADDTDLGGIELLGNEGVVVETPGVRVFDPDRGLCEVDFRIRAAKPGVHRLDVRTPERTESKRIAVAKPLHLLSPRRGGGGVFERAFGPGEKPLPADGPITAIEVAYPTAIHDFLGIEWAWWTLFLVFMILSLLLLRGPLGVQF